MKDAVGNDIKVGDLVLLQLERPTIYGRVMELTDGGIIQVQQPYGRTNVRPSRMVIVSNHPIEVDPRIPCGAVVCLRDAAEVLTPAEPEAKNEEKKDELPN